MIRYAEYVEYPPLLPKPQSNFSGTVETPTQVTSFTSGRRRKRKIGRTTVKAVTLEWLFSPDEYDLWEHFFRVELNDGCDQFKIDMASGGGLQTGPHVVQCVGDYSFSYEECNWRVSVDCAMYAYPVGNGIGILETMLGFTIAQMEEVINKYYDKRHML